MKRFYLIILMVIVLGNSVKSQSLAAQNATPYLSGDANTTLVGLVDIFNTSTNDLNVLVERVINNTAPNHFSYFCWGPTCYGPATSLSPSPEFIISGTVNSTFRGDAVANGYPGLTRVTYCFFDQSNNSDSVCLEFVYDFTTVGINENVTQENFLSHAVPNPCDAFAKISYNLSKPSSDVRIVLNNMLGAKVKEFRMDGQRKTFLLNTSGLQSGLYFYSLIADNAVISTARLVVNHKN